MMGVLPTHARVGKQNYNSIDNDQSKIQPLMRHFEYHLELGEVRATRTVSTLVDGMQGRTNRDNDDEAIFLPRYMGYRNCYKRYMASLGYNVRTTGSGVTIVEPREDGEPEDPSEYVSFPSYFYKWKEHFPQLRVSKAMEDICQYCYAFSNRHRYLSNRAIRRNNKNVMRKTMKTVTTSMHPQQETKPTSKATVITSLSAASSLKVRMVTMATTRVLRALLQHHHQAAAPSI